MRRGDPSVPAPRRGGASRGQRRARDLMRASVASTTCVELRWAVSSGAPRRSFVAEEDGANGHGGDIKTGTRHTI
eukprot:scaffold25262_cov118-Isochrysis_galbana.AAC.2